MNFSFFSENQGNLSNYEIIDHHPHYPSLSISYGVSNREEDGIKKLSRKTENAFLLAIQYQPPQKLICETDHGRNIWG